MIAAYPGDEARHAYAAPPAPPSGPDLPHESDVPHAPHPSSRSATAAGDDLWSAPSSALPIDLDLDDEVFASLGPLGTRDTGQKGGVSGTPAPETRPDPDQDRPVPEGGRLQHRSTGVALFVAVLVLLGLGFTAQWLDAPGGSDSQPDGGLATTIRTSSPLPSASPRPSPRISSMVDLVTEGSPDCPRRLSPEAQATQAPTSDGPQCFFIG